MIEHGTINRAIIVAGENGKPLVDETVNLLNNGEFDRKSIKPYFANLTIGGGAVAWSICSQSATTFPALGYHNSQALPTQVTINSVKGTNHQEVCLCKLILKELLHAGISVASHAWRKFLTATNWSPQSPELVVTHQVGKAHQQEIESALSYDPQKSFTTYESLGNCGSVSLPITYTLACEQNSGFLKSKSALLGIGSGLSSLMLALNN